MSTTTSVLALVEHLKAGNEAAARQLWETYYPRLVAIARKKLQDTPRRVADEEDVALSAFDSFCRHAEQGRFPQLNDRDGLWRLLVVITARKAADLANHHNRRKRGGGAVRGDSAFSDTGSEEIVADTPPPDEEALFAEEFAHLLDRLGKDELRSIAIWKFEGFSNAEIASRLGCAEATVERRLQLIRKMLTKSDG